MHEISIMQSTLEAAIETAQRAAATHILGLRVRVGVMTGVAPDALQFAFEVLRDGTMAAGASLEIESVPARRWCPVCQVEFEANDWRQACSVCGRLGSELRHGMELELASVEVE
jgi:hydrogenase nickel incorporation protein HypA/HybF